MRNTVDSQWIAAGHIGKLAIPLLSFVEYNTALPVIELRGEVKLG